VAAAATQALATTPAPIGTSTPRPAETVAALPYNSPAAGFRAIVAGPLADGRYSTTAFNPRLTFQLGPGWTGLFPDDADEIAIDFGGSGGVAITRVTEVVDQGSGRPSPVPDNLVAWLSGNRALKLLGAPRTVTVAGHAGETLEASAIANRELFAYPTGNMRVGRGMRLRYTVIPMDGPDLTIVIAGEPESDFDELLVAVEPVLASLAIYAER
jgi:hypothetical protein